MANSITIDVRQFTDLGNRFKGYEKELRDGVEGILYKNAAALSLQAKQRAPKDMSGLASSISAPVNTADLEFTVSVNAFYAAFQEFGTGKYAAQYASSLPEDWRTYAASFRGRKGNEGFDKFIEHMRGWLKRHGLDEGLAYVVCRKILINGVRPQPFLYPAYQYVKPFILKDIETLLKSLNP